MKILFLTRRFYPDIGGVEKHVLEVSNRLVARGHQITVISENYHSIDQSDTKHIKSKQAVKSGQSTYFERGRIKIYRLNVGANNRFKKFRIWLGMLGVAREIRDADVVHCHDVFFWYLPFRFLFPEKKVFTTFHGYEDFPVKKKEIFIRKLSEFLSHGTICIGSFIKKWYRTNPDYITYGGVDFERKIKKINAPKAIFFGRLDDKTDVRIYLKAATLIKAKIPNFSLEVINDDPIVTKRLLEFRYAFVSGYLSILESLAARKMVFAVYDNPLKKDYLEMTTFKSFINICQNPKELASKVQYFYSNKYIEQQQVKQGYKWVKSQSWDKVADIYLKLWRK